MRRLMLALILSLVVSACGAHTTKAPTVSGEVGWPKAQELLTNCQVKNLAQTHSRVVTLKLRGGETVTSREPSIDDIYTILARLPHDCQPQTVATE